MEAVPAEVGPLQVLAESLQVRFRAEVAAQRFDDAIRTARTMFAVGRHLGEHPTAVADLVGLWAAHLGLDTLEEMVQQPTCPNLYWALTDLPCPLVDLRKGVQGDRILVATLLRPIRDDAPMSAAEIESLVGRTLRRAELRPRAGGRAAPQPAGPAASQSQGRSDRRRRPPPPGRGRPYAGPRQQALAGSGHSAGGEERLRDPAGRSDQAAGLAASGSSTPWPAPRIVRRIGTGCSPISCRTSSSFAGHRARLRAADRDAPDTSRPCGSTPRGMAVSCPQSYRRSPCPCPVDPVTGKPFAYEVEGATAHLRGGVLQGNGQEPGCRCGVHYSVTLMK